MERVYDFLKKAGTYFIATCSKDKPFVRPFGTVDLFEGRLYFQTGRKKEVYRQLKENPAVEICAYSGSEWIRVSGTAVEDERLEPSVHMLDSYPSLKQMYAPGDGNNTVFYLMDVSAVIASFTKEPAVIKF